MLQDYTRYFQEHVSCRDLTCFCFRFKIIVRCGILFRYCMGYHIAKHLSHKKLLLFHPHLFLQNSAGEWDLEWSIIPFSIDAVIFLHYHHFPFDRNNCGSDPNGNSVGTWCIAVEWYAWMHAGIENTIQLVQGPSTMTKRWPMADRLKCTEKAKR